MQPDAHGRTPSLTAVQRNFFRTTVGDFQPFCPHAMRWVKRAVEDAVGHADTDAISLLQMKPIRRYTPAVSMQQLTFGPNEILSVLLDPGLHCSSKHVKALNANLKALAARNARELHFMRTAYNEMLSAAENYQKIYQVYHNKRGIANDFTSEECATMKETLSMIELHPFYTLSTQQVVGVTGKKEFSMERRKTYLEMPLMDLATIHLWGVQLLALGATHGAVASANKALTDFITSGTDEKNITANCHQH